MQMKTLKIKIVLIIIMIVYASYGFVDKLITSEKLTKNQTGPNEDILGTWVLENDTETKIEFLSDGTVKSYESNVLKHIDLYSISSTCGSFTSADDGLYLKTIDVIDGTQYCEIINGLDNSPGGLLSLTDDSGRLIIYVRK